MARILLLNRVYPPRFGTSGRLLRDLCRTLVKGGHDVTLVTGGGKDTEKSEGGKIRIEYVRDATNPAAGSNLLLLFRMWRKARKITPAPDVVISLADPPFLFVAGQMLARKFKCKHIHWCHDVHPDLVGIYYPWMTKGLLKPFIWFGRTIMAKADAVVAISGCMQKYLQRTSFKGMNLTRIDHWPDPALKYTLEMDAEYEIDRVRPVELNGTPAAQRFQVLYVGSLNPAHPIETVLDAAAMLQTSDPDVLFTFVGRGKGFTDLIAARSRRALENIRLLPPQPLDAQADFLTSGQVHLAVQGDDTVGLMLPAKALNAASAARPLVFVGPATSDLAHKASAHVHHGDAIGLANIIRAYKSDMQKLATDGQRVANAFAQQSAHAQLLKWLSLVDEIAPRG